MACVAGHGSAAGAGPGRGARTARRAQPGGGPAPAAAAPKPKRKAKRKRGRPQVAKWSPLKLTPEALDKLLSTEAGLNKYEAEVMLRLRRGGTALELDGMGRELRIIRDRRAALLRRQNADDIAELKQGLAEINRHMSGKQGSALRADMAPAPPPARGTGTLQ